GHDLRARSAFRLTYAEDDYDLTMLSDLFEDEPVCWVDFQSVGAPPKLLRRCGIATADEIYPECVVDDRLYLVSTEVETAVHRRIVHPLERAVDIIDDLRRFDESIRGNYVDGLCKFGLRQLREG